MTNETQRCAECGWHLRYDDHNCFKCGTPTPTNPDPDSTVPDPKREETAPDESEPLGPIPTGAEFNEAFRKILGSGYEILGLIGQGGFARVYRARDKRLDRIVAIKVIRPDVVGTPLYVESFRSEGIALAKLRHPGIVPIYDIRERRGLIYYMMPYVQGLSLEARMEEGRLPPFEARRILSDLADALSAAHRAKMVHLDIKPANVFLEGDHQKVLLMDFGTAMTVSEQLEEGSDGPVVGTPEYMSPEQAQNLPEIDHRSDIYSMGCLGYTMLMGRPPFVGRDPTKVLLSHVQETPTPIRDINPSVPKEFADVIMRCLEKDPWERYATAKDVSSALDAVTFFTGRRSSSVQKTEVDADSPNMVRVVGGVALIVGLLIGLVL